MLGIRIEHALRDLGIRRHALRTMRGSLVEQYLCETREDIALENCEFIIAVLSQALFLGLLDRHGTLVLVDAVAVEHPHFDDSSCDTRRNAQRRVANIRRLFAED